MENETLIREKLDYLNRHYGRGDIVRVDFNETTGEGVAVARLQYGESRFRFTVRGNVLRARGHKLVLRKGE